MELRMKKYFWGSLKNPIFAKRFTRAWQERGGGVSEGG